MWRTKDFRSIECAGAIRDDVQRPESPRERPPRSEIFAPLRWKHPVEFFAFLRQGQTAHDFPTTVTAPQRNPPTPSPTPPPSPHSPQFLRCLLARPRTRSPQARLLGRTASLLLCVDPGALRCASLLCCREVSVGSQGRYPHRASPLPPSLPRCRDATERCYLHERITASSNVV